MPTSLPTEPSIDGRNIAIRIDLTICAPMKNGRRSFFSPKARKPKPKPVRKEFFPKSLAREHKNRDALANGSQKSIPSFKQHSQNRPGRRLP